MRFAFGILLSAMVLSLTTGCGSSGGTTAAGPAPAPGKGDNKDGTPTPTPTAGPLKLEGTYVLISMEVDGETIPEAVKSSEADRTTKFTADKMISNARGKETALTYKLDATKSPAHIDIIMTEGKKDHTLLGIVKLEGDTLTICNGRERPTAFKTKGNQAVMSTMKKK
ncbi:MAG: TIGR03067 domain-containing protein [Planctomycetes bacterium]|nr:TIGR03067 domain-containing protein [Planctomycetota bacterium]